MRFRDSYVSLYRARRSTISKVQIGTYIEAFELSDVSADLQHVVFVEERGAVLEEPFPGTFAFEELQNFDFYADEPTQITTVQIEADRLPKEIFYAPAFVLLILIIALQRRRADKPAF